MPIIQIIDIRAVIKIIVFLKCKSRRFILKCLMLSSVDN